MQHVDVKVHGSVATVMMDRPQCRNALSPQMFADLRLALSDIHQEKRVGAVLLTGAGEHFCSGIDLKVLGEIAALPDHEAIMEWQSIWRQLTELLEEMLRFPKPIVAAIDGGAIGAGLGLALACDMFVMSNRATLSAVAVRRGLVGGATVALLAFRFGSAIAARMSLAGEALAAEQAHRLGMCDQPVSPDQIWVSASGLAEKCTQAPHEALQATKRLLNEAIGENLLTQLSVGAADSATACSTESAVEGIKSFLEDREPNWP